MKAFAFAALLALIACTKKPSAETTSATGSSPGSGSSAGAAAGSSAGSSAQGSAGAATPPSSASAQAVEDFDRAFAPIYKLSGGARVRALCTHLKSLDDRGVALVKAAPTGSAAADWNDASREVSGLVGDIAHGCGQIPKKAFAGNDDALAEADVASAGDMANGLHDSFKKLAALAPGAKPVDSHAGDPLPPSDAPSAPVDVAHVRAALHALDDAVVKLAANAKKRKSRDDACKGIDKLVSLNAALTSADVAAGPPGADDWGGNVSNVGMVIGQFSTTCADAKTKPADIAAALDSLHDHLAKMLAMAK